MGKVAYIRQSRRADLDVALSYDAQLAAIEKMAGPDVAILSDMGRSGKGGGERLRPGYCNLIKGIESGAYTDVYAIALSRFSRSVPELHHIMELAKQNGVRITTAKEGSMDPHTATGRMIFNTWANFAEFVRDMAVEAALENAGVRRSRGERMGRIPYGERPGDQPDAVKAAYHDAHESLNGAARLLNERGIPSWSGTYWTGPAVRLVMVRLDADIMPKRPNRGVKPSSPFMLYRLLVCPCGNRMTASRDGKYVIYRCHQADARSDHQPKYRVRESAILPAIAAEAARLRVPMDEVEVRVTDQERRGTLNAKRQRVMDAFIDGAIDRDERARRLDVIDTEIEALDSRQTVKTVPEAIDWAWPAKSIHTVLAALFNSIQLDANLRPSVFDWKVREWRAD